jgi:D-beta-D-heptose 7-phosphate kinase/D-beta-D-heptose 1-phosphate adenosyltransferase
MLEFEKHLQGIAQQTILCVGDLMLDDFVYGEVARISPEAPAPVLAVKRNEIAIGGAGTSRATSPRSARAAFSSAWSATTMPGARSLRDCRPIR